MEEGKYSDRLIHGLPTSFLTYGKTIDDNLMDCKYLLLMIPGNPGQIEAYRVFLSELYQDLRSQFPHLSIPVWGITHGGHQEGQTNVAGPNLKEFPNLYDLEGQIEHKMEFVRQILPPHAKILLLAHSIGAKMSIELVKRNERFEKQLLRGFLLFPTIERMRETPNGKSLTPKLSLQRIIFLLLAPVFWMPKFLHRLVLKCILWPSAPPPCVLDSGLNLFNKNILERVLWLAKAEMDQVVDLDVEGIATHKSKLFFYCGTEDHWAPLHYLADMLQVLPTLEYEVCSHGINHAFVIESSSLMAKILKPKLAQTIHQHLIPLGKLMGRDE